MKYSLLFLLFLILSCCHVSISAFGGQNLPTTTINSLLEKSSKQVFSRILQGEEKVGNDVEPTNIPSGDDVEPTSIPSGDDEKPPNISLGSNVGQTSLPDNNNEENETLDTLPSSEKEILLSTGIFLLLLMLGIILVITHCLHLWKIEFLQMPICATILGIMVGAIFKLGVRSNKTILTQILALNEDVFFIFLLPPIIFEAGISITRDALGHHFFVNFGTILWYAIFCTLVSFCFIGGLIHFVGMLHISTPLTLRQSFSFGALISSTDPVSVLAMFKHLPPNKLLHAIIVGESLFNDAISIVLYKSIIAEGSSGLGVIMASFLFTFLFSIMIGVGIGLISALVYKKVDFSRSANTINEVALMLLFAWGAYSVAESYNFSGIVSICFCGITMGKYTSSNLSNAGRATMETLFSIMAMLAETVVFLFLGLAVFSFHHDGNASLHFSAFWIVSLGRCVSVYLTSMIVNLLRRNKIPPNFQHALVICGLRGAIAFALSERAKHDFGGTAGSALLSVTLFYSLFSIIVVGCSLKWSLEKLKIFELETAAAPLLKASYSTDHSNLNGYTFDRDDEKTERFATHGKFKTLLLFIDHRIMRPFFLRNGKLEPIEINSTYPEPPAFNSSSFWVWIRTLLGSFFNRNRGGVERHPHAFSTFDVVSISGKNNERKYDHSISFDALDDDDDEDILSFLSEDAHDHSMAATTTSPYY